MRETLYIRLRAVEPTAPTAFCIAAGDAVSSFPVETDSLEAVLQRAPGRRVVALVPAADIRLTGVNLPARQSAKALKAVPYALEEQLAEDVDTLHFALGARQPGDRWPVAATARSRVDQWLSVFSAAGLRPDALIPDLLALPVPEDGQYTLLIDDGEVLVRTGIDSGFVCARDDLALCLGIADPEHRHRRLVMVPRDAAFDPAVLGADVEVRHGYAAPLEALLLNLSRDSINLLQGDYSAQQDWLRVWRPWRAAAVLCLAAVLLGAANHGLRAHRYALALERQQAENRARFQQLFPGETRIVNLGAQLDQQIARLGRDDADAGLLPLLAVAASAAAAVPGLIVQSVQYRDRSLYVALAAKSLQDLDRLKTWFAEGRKPALDVQSANAGADGVRIRIKLTPQ